MGRLAHLQESTLLAIHKPLEVARARGLAQLAQRLGLAPQPFTEPVRARSSGDSLVSTETDWMVDDSV